MQDVRNALGKLVCRADRKLRRVEIVRKGQLTVLTFESNGTMRITNLPKTLEGVCVSIFFPLFGLARDYL